jgi:hypothetical protein
VCNALAYNEAMPLEAVIWEMAERTGWTLEYIEGLAMAKLHEYEQYRAGLIKAQSSFFVNSPSRIRGV